MRNVKAVYMVRGKRLTSAENVEEGESKLNPTGICLITKEGQRMSPSHVFCFFSHRWLSICSLF